MIDISNMGDDALADICEKIRKDRISGSWLHIPAL